MDPGPRLVAGVLPRVAWTPTAFARSALCIALSITGGCGSRTGLSEGEAPLPTDAGPRDAGPPDAGPPDAGPPDAGPPGPIVWQRSSFRIEQAQLFDVSVRQNGDFLVLYGVPALFNPDRDGSVVRAQLFGPDGEPISDPIDVYRSERFGVSGVATFLADGGFVIAFPVDIGGGLGRVDYAVRVRRYDASGAATDSGESEFPNEWRPKLVTTLGGGFVTMMSRLDRTIGTTDATVRLHGVSGVALGLVIGVLPGCDNFAEVTAGFALRCVQADGSVAVQQYSISGASRGVLLRAQPHPDHPGISALVPRSDTGYLVSSGPYVRELDLAGTPLGTWHDIRRADETSFLPESVGIARSGCPGRACRYDTLWRDQNTSEGSRPVERGLDALGRPLEGPDALDAPPITFEGPRIHYGHSEVSGGSGGTVVWAWDAVDRERRGQRLLLVEGSIVSAQVR